VLKGRPAQKFAFAAVLAISIAVAQGQTPPNLSGTWKCNIDKSNWGNSTPPPNLTVKISHKDPDMTMTQIIAGQSDQLRFVIDGRENTNDISQGTLKSKLTWERDVLVVETRVIDREVTLSDRLTLSPDGKTIRVIRRIKAPDVETVRELIFEKQ
jgi:hypothetical protein